MVYGPIAAFLVEMFPVKLDTHQCHCHINVGNGILEVTSCYFNYFVKDLGHPEFYLKDFGIQLLSLQSVL
jgi:hypothetical protein